MAERAEERFYAELSTCSRDLDGIRGELSTLMEGYSTRLKALQDSIAQVQNSSSQLGTQLNLIQGESVQLASQLEQTRCVTAKLQEMQATLQRVQSTRLPTAAAAGGIDPELIKTALQRLAAGTTQEEILQTYVELAGSRVERAILFLSRDNQYFPWRSLGFPPGSLDSVVVTDPNDPIVRVASGKHLVYREQAPAEDRPSLHDTGRLPQAFVAIPFVFEDFVPVVFYGDASRPIPTDDLEILTHLAVLVLKNQSLRQLVSGQAAAPVPPAEVVEAAVAPEPPAVVPEPAAEEVRQPTSVIEEIAKAEESFVSPAVEVAVSAPIEELVEPTAPPAVGSIIEVTEEPTIEVIEEPVIEVTAGPTVEEGVVAPVEEFAPQPPVEEIFLPPIEIPAEPAALAEELPPPPAPISVEEVVIPPTPTLPREEEEKFDNEARRFARLLVSEIKLYNEDEVYTGRQAADLYGRLKRDIDRSREMYEKRVHPAIAVRTDHFHDELIRILAREDEKLMGPGYPGRMIRT